MLFRAFLARGVLFLGQTLANILSVLHFLTLCSGFAPVAARAVQGDQVHRKGKCQWDISPDKEIIPYFAVLSQLLVWRALRRAPGSWFDVSDMRSIWPQTFLTPLG